MDTDCESSSDNSDFNFGDTTISDNVHAQETEDDSKEIDCNLTLHEPRWFLNDINVNVKEPSECHRNNKLLKTERYRCELLYAQKKYKEALLVIEDIFVRFDIDPNIQYGNELTDILMRCLYKVNECNKALPYIDKLLVRDVSFGSLKLINLLYIATRQHQKAFTYAMDLTIKEPLNPICWYLLAISCKNKKDFDFCFVCLRSLVFNIEMFKDAKRYKESVQYLNELLRFAQKEMTVVKPNLVIKELGDSELRDIWLVLQKQKSKLLDFLQQAWRRFSF